MKRLFLSFLLTPFFGIAQNKVDFGIEVQMNQNLVRKWDAGYIYDTINHALSILDTENDTLNIYLNKFGMEKNFEIPIYFRYNWKNRQFLDFKLSNSFNTLTMEGVSNYNDSYYIENYGSFQDFEAQAILDGFTGIDTSDYVNYINTAKEDWESRIKMTEQFQLLSLTMNYGYRFFPHKSIKAFVGFGFSIKGKYRKVNYQYLDFSNDYVKDLSVIEPAINKFSETSLYTNFIAGLEMYRFRLSLFYQSGIGYVFTPATPTEQVVYVYPWTPFDRIHSYGFSLGVDLFTRDVGQGVNIDELSGDDLGISKMKRTSAKWEMGIRFNRRGFNDLTTYYTDPENQLSMMTMDSVLINLNGTITSARNIEVLTFGDVKRITWSGQFDIFGDYHFSPRFSAEMSLGFSALNFEVATRELKATIATDSLGNGFFVESASSPRLRSAAFRKGFALFNSTFVLAYKLVDRDLLDIRVKIGGGLTLMGHVFVGTEGLPEGINGLSIYGEAEEAYFWIEDGDVYAYQGDLDVDLKQSPDIFMNKFPDYQIGHGWQSPQKIRMYYPTVYFGFDASIDRYTIGLSFESSANYMDGFMLKEYGSIYFSIGYKLWTR